MSIPIPRRPIYQARSSARAAKPLKRTQMKRSRKKRPAHLVDRAYSAWLHLQPCCVPGCNIRRMEQHHKREGAGGAAIGHDHDSISLCYLHHVTGIHALAGPFKGWVRQQVRDFVSYHVGRLRAEYLRVGGFDMTQPGVLPTPTPW
jgi:hypothetical protein